MANAATVNSIAELQTAATFPGAVSLLGDAGRAGTFVWRTGNFAARLASDPLKGIYVPSSTTMPTIGCWVREWDETNGRPEWFGAVTDDPTVDNRAALTACFALCPVTVLGSHDYYVRDTLVLDRSNRALVGAPLTAIARNRGVGPPARMGEPGHSRVILAGPRVATATVLQFGKAIPPRSDSAELMRNSVLRNLVICRDNDGPNRVRTSSDGSLTGCVKGIVCSGVNSGLIENVSSFDSPIGWYCHGCVYTKWNDCAAWRTTAAADPTNDYSIGFLIGGYAINYGYAGANASVYFNRCAAYDLTGGSISVGVKLFGAVADTFLTQIEVGRCHIGIEIDGRGPDGATIPLSRVGSQNNVHLINPIIDATTEQGLQLRNLNASFQVAITSLYIATASAKQDLHIMGGADRVEGHVSIVGGTMFGGGNGSTGIVATDVTGISVLGTLLRNYGKPVTLTGCSNCRMEPDIFNYAALAAGAVVLADPRRCSLKPIVRSTLGHRGFATGIEIRGGDHNTIDAGMVDTEALATARAEQAVRYGGEDARASAAFKAAGNVLVGAT